MSSGITIMASVYDGRQRAGCDKEKSRALAIQFWPGCGFFSRKKDHGRAEAALIARYGAETIATNFAAPSGKGEATAFRRHNEQRKELNHE